MNMKNNICFKLFTFVFMFLLFSVTAIASDMDITPNVLTKIVIEPTENNSFNFNLFFNKKFTENAFLQKKKDGTYNVFIPDTVMNAKKTKLIYINNEDSNIVKVKMEEKPLVRGNSQSNYVRLTVDIKNDYAIRLLAKTEEPKSGIPFLFVNFYSMLIIVSVGMILLIIAKSNKNNTKRNKTVSYTHFPSSYLSSPQDYIYSRSTGMDIPQQKPILPKVNIKKNLKTADSDSFSCFDIPLVEDTKNSSYEFKSTLKQTSNLMKEKTAKSKQTNPINRTYAEENSQFSLPVVDDLPVIEKPIIQESKKNEPELISALNITPNKGFYLTTAEDDMFALFGFVGDNVFLLKKFIDLTQINLQARYYDRAQNGNEIYIVRMDSYKAMIEVSNNGMRETAVL